MRARRARRPLLANLLIARAHDDAPVTLVGVSIGARVAFACCAELARRGARAPPLPP
jgi:thioesterase domain-containing protein